MTTRPCLLLAASLLGAAATAEAQSLVYYGGPVISRIQVIQVAWGPDVHSDAQSKLTGFLTTIVSSPYLDWLEEYDTHRNGQDGQPGSNQVIGRGTFVGAFTIAPANTATVITDAEIQTELSAQITAGSLPAPHVDSNGYVDSFYMVNFPPGVTITLSTGGHSCSSGGFCAYHGAWLASAGSLPYSGKAIPYSTIPDFGPTSACATGCGGTAVAFDNLTTLESQQIAEVITDVEFPFSPTTYARPSGWLDPLKGEIGVICRGQLANLGTYTVHKGWSNSQNSCVATVDEPICTGANGPACRLCNLSDDAPDGGCGGPTPYCATEPGSALEGRCIECRDGSQCPRSTPICDAVTSGCRPCNATDCTAPLSVCEISGSHAGSCVACDATTGAGCPAATPHCDTTSDTCVECLGATDCPSARPVCDASHICQPSGTTGGSTGGSTGGGTGGETTGHKSGCATGGNELLLPWLLLLSALRRPFRLRA